jgi:hypothetical protein
MPGKQERVLVVLMACPGDKLRGGKRYSQLLFHDIVCDYALPPWGYLCMDADVAVTVSNVR